MKFLKNRQKIPQNSIEILNNLKKSRKFDENPQNSLHNRPEILKIRWHSSKIVKNPKNSIEILNNPNKSQKFDGNTQKSNKFIHT